MEQTTLNFGKFKGHSLHNLAQEESRYLIWLYKQPWVSHETKKAIDTVLDDVVMEFGRYKGRLLSEIKRRDPRYYRWLFTPEVKPELPKEDSESDTEIVEQDSEF